MLIGGESPRTSIGIAGGGAVRKEAMGQARWARAERTDWGQGGQWSGAVARLIESDEAARSLEGSVSRRVGAGRLLGGWCRIVRELAEALRRSRWQARRVHEILLIHRAGRAAPVWMAKASRLMHGKPAGGCSAW